MNRLEHIKENMASCTDSYVDNSEFLDDMRYMLQRLERYENSLKEITHLSLGGPEPRVLEINRIAEEALKE